MSYWQLAVDYGVPANYAMSGGRAWFDVAREVQGKFGNAALGRLIEQDYFEDWPSFSSADRAKLWNWIGAEIAAQQDREASARRRAQVLKVASVATSFIPGLGQAAALALSAAGKLAVARAENKASNLTAGYAAREALGNLPQEQSMLNGSGLDLGSLITRGIDAYTQYRLQARAAEAPLALPGAPIAPAIQVAGLGGLIGRMLPTVGAVGGAVVRAGSRMIQTAMGAMSKKRVAAIAKQLGIQGAATALGIGAVEVAQAVLDSSKSRRSSGITAAQLRTTRKTIGKVVRAHRYIVESCNAARVARRGRFAPRKASCPAPRVIVTKR